MSHTNGLKENVTIGITYWVEWGFLRLASSLAAVIKKKFGITAKLIEGHNGIYKVTINSNVVYTNQGKCSQLPRNEVILGEIRKYKDLLPGEEITATEAFPIFKP